MPNFSLRIPSVASVAGACVTGILLMLSGCAKTSEPTRTTSGTTAAAKPPVTLLNVSYDPTREFYQEFNQAFSTYWKSKSGQVVTIDQSHGGSGKQARAVIDGLEADVVTLALGYDIDAIAEHGGLIREDWRTRLPQGSAPYTSTIVFLVRKGNPKGIKDWGDLLRDDLAIITANPKTSGGARWNYLAAWGYALRSGIGAWSDLKDPTKQEAVTAAQAKAKEYVRALYAKVPVLDSGARGSTNTFVQRGIGDVLIAWENEAFLAVKEMGNDSVEIVVPRQSILAEPPVALVDKFAEKHGTTEVASAYLLHLYSPDGQQIAARHHFRPSIPESISAAERDAFAQVELFTVDEAFGGWQAAQREHFQDGGIFDQIYQPTDAAQ